MIEFSIIGSVLVATISTVIMVRANLKSTRETDIEVASSARLETVQEQEEQNSPKALTEISARTPNTNNFTYVTSEDGIQVPVPKGYVASTDTEERYVNGVKTEGVREHHGGFVIYEKKCRRNRCASNRNYIRRFRYSTKNKKSMGMDTDN